MTCPHLARALPQDRVIPFNYKTGVMHSDPWTRLHELASGPGFFFSPELGGHWCAARRDIVVNILRNSDLFSTKHIRVPPVERSVPSIPHHLDPPEHGKYRLGVVELFGHRVLDVLAPDIEETARRLTKEFVSAGSGEFVKGFAMRMPVEIFMRMLGLPLERRDELTGWVHSYFHGGTAEESNRAHDLSVSFLEGWLDERLADRSDSRGHIMPALLRTRVDGRPLTRQEMLSIVITLFNGGLDTVAAQMTHVLRHLAEHPEEREQLVRDQSRIPTAIEELLRRYSIISIARVVVKDAVFEGMPLRAGDMVLCLISAAGLDESQFPNAMQVDFDRQNKQRHCAFGSGIHMCVGAPLARLELKVMLRELLPRLPNLRIRPGSILTYHTGVTLGLETLPLEWDAGVGPGVSAGRML